MKTLLLIISLFVATNGIGQKKVKIKSSDTASLILREQNGTPYYSEVVLVDSSIKQSTLFLRAKKWFVDYYKSAKDVIQLEDRESGEIIGKGVCALKIGFVGIDVYHTVRIYVKDGKYKYEITNLSSKQHIPGGVGLLGSTTARTEDLEISNHYVSRNKRDYQALLKLIHANILVTIESLKNYMTKTNNDF